MVPWQNQHFWAFPVIDFLKDHGLPTESTEDIVKLADYGNVTIEPLEHDISSNILKEIDFTSSRTKFFEKPLYCRLLTVSSPVKNDKGNDKTVNDIEETTPVKAGPGKFVPAQKIKSKLISGSVSEADEESSSNESSAKTAKKQTPNKEQFMKKRERESNGPSSDSKKQANKVLKTGGKNKDKK